MKNTEDITQDEAIRGDVKTYELCVNPDGEAELKEVDTFYFMAQDELGDNVPIVELRSNMRRLAKESYEHEKNASSEPASAYLSREERRAISPLRTALQNAADKMREVYQKTSDFTTGKDVLADLGRKTRDSRVYN